MASIGKTIENFFHYIRYSPFTQWIVLILLYPFAFLFDLFFSVMFKELAEYMLAAFGLDYDISNFIDYTIYLAMPYFILSSLLCFLIMKNKMMHLIWMLLGFLYGGKVVFYASSLVFFHHYFKDSKGVLFWRPHDLSDKTICFRVLLFILLIGICYPLIDIILSI